MDISIDFGITVTDILKRNQGVMSHQMTLSKEEPSQALLNKLLSDVNFKSEDISNQRKRPNYILTRMLKFL